MTQETPTLTSTHDDAKSGMTASRDKAVAFIYNNDRSSPTWACPLPSNSDDHMLSHYGANITGAHTASLAAGVTQSLAIPNARVPTPPRAASPLPGKELGALPFSGRASRHQKLPSSFIYRGAFSSFSESDDEDSDDELEGPEIGRWSRSTLGSSELDNDRDNSLFTLDEDYFSASDDDSGRSTSCSSRQSLSRASPPASLVQARTSLLSSYRSVKDIHASYLSSSNSDWSLHRTRSCPSLAQLQLQSEEPERRRSLPIPIRST